MPISVFLADDHAVVREGLAGLLALQSDLKVIGTAADGRDTVRQVVALQPDVVIMDIAMPQMNGIEAARAIRERVPTARLLILSMHSSVEHVFHALEAGAHGYVLKDSAAQDIIEAVRAVRAGRRYLSPRIGEMMAEVVMRRDDKSPLNRLSGRERQILQLVAEGRSSAQIAATLHLSPKTVDTYRSRLMQKLHIGDVAGLVKFAIQHGFTSLDQTRNAPDR
jgi:DNA-binding NarL/FixJ family response regulator